MVYMPVVENHAPIKMMVDQIHKIYINNYEDLANQPQINNVLLIGNKTAEDLGLEYETEIISQLDILKIFNRTIQ